VRKGSEKKKHGRSAGKSQRDVYLQGTLKKRSDLLFLPDGMYGKPEKSNWTRGHFEREALMRPSSICECMFHGIRKRHPVATGGEGGKKLSRQQKRHRHDGLNYREGCSERCTKRERTKERQGRSWRGKGGGYHQK